MKAIRDKMVRPALLAGALLALSQGAAAQQVLIGTGALDPMQFSVGRAICHLAARAEAAGCQPVETSGPIDSLVNVAGVFGEQDPALPLSGSRIDVNFRLLIWRIVALLSADAECCAERR